MATSISRKTITRKSTPVSSSAPRSISSTSTKSTTTTTVSTMGAKTLRTTNRTVARRRTSSSTTALVSAELARASSTEATTTAETMGITIVTRVAAAAMAALTITVAATIIADRTTLASGDRWCLRADRNQRPGTRSASPHERERPRPRSHVTIGGPRTDHCAGPSCVRSAYGLFAKYSSRCESPDTMISSSALIRVDESAYSKRCLGRRIASTFTP